MELLDLMETTTSQYKQTLHNLHLIDASITSMFSVVDSLQQKLDWIVAWLGGTRDELHVPTALVVHMAFAFLAMLCLVFVGAPGMTRVGLLIMVVGNVVMEINFRCSLNMSSMASLQAVFLIGK